MRIAIAVSLVALAASAATAGAQRTVAAATPTALELGVDATADIGLGDNSFTVVNIPSGSIRVGFPMTPRVSIEPRASLSVVSGDGDTFTTYALQVGLLYHMDDNKMQREGVYVRPAIGLSGANGGGTSHNTFFGGAGIGYKKPILAQLGSRFEAAFFHNFNNGSANEIELSAGLSWFTH